MREVGADGRLVERGDRDREMVDVAAFAARRRAARRAQLAVDGDEIDQRTAGAQLKEADSGLHALVGAADTLEWKSGVLGRVCAMCVDLGGSLTIKKKINN